MIKCSNNNCMEGVFRLKRHYGYYDLSSEYAGTSSGIARNARSAAESPVNTRVTRDSRYTILTIRTSGRVSMSLSLSLSRANESNADAIYWHAKPFMINQTRASRPRTEKESDGKDEKEKKRDERGTGRSFLRKLSPVHNDQQLSLRVQEPL